MLSILKTDKEILKDIAKRERKRRKYYKLTQKQLADKSGVSFGSVKRFENTGEISLKSLLKIAFVLDSQAEFDKLFDIQLTDYRDINDILKYERQR